LGNGRAGLRLQEASMDPQPLVQAGPPAGGLGTSALGSRPVAAAGGTPPTAARELPSPQPGQCRGLDLQPVPRAEPVWLPTRLPAPAPQTAAPAGPGQRLLAALLARPSAPARQAGAASAASSGTAWAAEAAQRLLAAGPGPANELALRYQADLRQRGLAAATVNRRLAALRSLVKLARTLGLVGWSLEVQG